MQTEEVVDQVTMKRALTRITYEITEGNYSIQDIVLVGIKTQGIYVTSRIAERPKQLEDIDIPIGELDITLYRDDKEENPEEPELHSSDIPVSLEGREIILIDDVLYTGRMIRAAMDTVMDSGRPRRISSAVLVDRGHRELPIRTNYVGKNVPTSQAGEILVEMQELDEQDRIMILKEGD